MRLVEATYGSNTLSEMELNIPTNTDSGIQTVPSNTSHSTLPSEPGVSNCGRGTSTPVGGDPEDEERGGANEPITMETSFCTNQAIINE